MPMPTRAQLLWMYEMMVRIRDYEETMARVYLEGKLPPHIQKGLAFDIGAGAIPGEMHLAAGQEPVAVGVCVHLRQDDTVVGTHRPHHFAIAKGVPMPEMTAEIYGKVTGLGRGKGGHMHLFDPVHKFSCSGIIGASMPPACGAALAAKKRGKDWVAVAFFGEGATNQGAFHESMNLAALWRLPVAWFCENNLYAMGTALERSEAQTDLCVKAASYGVATLKVDGMDVVAVHEAAQRARAHAAQGAPIFVEFQTYRFRAHSMFDPELYRDKAEVEEWKTRGPIHTFTARLKAQGELTEERFLELDAAAQAEVDKAVAFAEAGTWEPIEGLTRHVVAS